MISRRRFLNGSMAGMAAAIMPRAHARQLFDSGESKLPGLTARKLYSFDYQSVTLSPGIFRQQYEQTRNFYLNLSSDDILKGYRANARPHRARLRHGRLGSVRYLNHLRSMAERDGPHGSSY